MTFLAMPWTGLKLVTQTQTLTSGFWESGNPGWYNLQSGVNMVIKDLNYVLEVDSIYLMSGPSTQVLPQLIKPVAVTTFGQKYFASGTLSNVVQLALQSASGNMVSGSAVTSGITVIVNALGF